MTRTALLLSAVVLASLSGCELLGGGGGGGGSGGGSGTNGFTKGFVFVRKDDRNVYAADDADLNTVFKLTTAGGARTPTLSRDGRTVVFSRVVGADTELDVVPTRGGTVSKVLGSSAVAKNLRLPVLSPDAKSIVFTYDEGTSSAIGLVNTDGTGFVKIAGGGSTSYVGPSFSPDGATVLVAFGSTSSTLTQLERVNVTTGQAQNVVSSLGPEAMVITGRAVLSPDGTQVAFDGRLASGATRVFVMQVGSGAVTRLTDYPSDPNASDSFPSWVGSGTVAFSSDTGGNDQVYELPATTVKGSGGLSLPSAIEASYGPN
ncbi:MAG: hypothetical protein K1X89_07140 [Myxococcaceae bacterium]|nr:hypothetical protein [Myxococcaceae bacterium]